MKNRILISFRVAHNSRGECEMKFVWNMKRCRRITWIDVIRLELRHYSLFFPINCFYQCFENFTYKLLETGWSLRVISRRIKLDFAKNFLSKVWITIINEPNGSCRTKFHGISNLFVVFRVTIARRINFFHASNQPRNIFLFTWI